MASMHDTLSVHAADSCAPHPCRLHMLRIIHCRHQHMWYPTEWNCPWLADPSCASINVRYFNVAYPPGCSTSQSISQSRCLTRCWLPTVSLVLPTDDSASSAWRTT